MRSKYIALALGALCVLILGGWFLLKRRPHVYGSRIDYALPMLPYALDALEPHIDTHTMELHYYKHHQGYVDKLNKALDDYPEVAARPLQEVLAHLDEVPEPIREAVRNNGGGHFNHTYYWFSMTPHGTQEPVSVAHEFSQVKNLINKQFGSFQAFKERFKEAGLSVFGSGWVWLVRDQYGDLAIVTTANQDTPLADGYMPLLALDLWEHAYYLKHYNDRAGYIDAWWNVVDWKRVEKNYQRAHAGIVSFP